MIKINSLHSCRENTLDYFHKNIDQMKNMTEFINSRFSKINEQTGLVTPKIAMNWSLSDSLRI